MHRCRTSGIPGYPGNPTVAQRAGRLRVADVTSYEPEIDGAPDPGEVVWAWVPYEEAPDRGKDRPVLLIARRALEGATYWAGLMLTSKDHDRDAAAEAREGRHWMDVGSGGWDREGRPSEVRLNRLLVLDPADIRREGAALDERVSS